MNNDNISPNLDFNQDADNELKDDITPSIENTEKSPKGKYIDPYNY